MDERYRSDGSGGMLISAEPDGDLEDAYEEWLEETGQTQGEDENGNVIDYNLNRSADINEGYETDGYETDGYEGGPIFYYDSEDEANMEDEPIRPSIVNSRCKRGCVGKQDLITLDNIKESDNAVLIDKQCYDSNSLMDALRYNQIIPHNRKRFTREQLNQVLRRENDNECIN